MQVLHRVITQAVVDGSDGQVSRGAVGLVTSRQEVGALLALDTYIDLVIPRGSGAMVKYIQDHTRIPVMGHAEGVCHVYVDASADEDAAAALVLDAKTNYPAACNTMETLLLHSALLVPGGAAKKIVSLLQENGVTTYSGPKLREAMTQAGGSALTGLHLPAAEALDIECVVWLLVPPRKCAC